MRKYLCIFICMAILLAGCKVNDNSISPVKSENVIIVKASNQSADAIDWKPTAYETVNNFDGVTMTVKKEQRPQPN